MPVYPYACSNDECEMFEETVEYRHKMSEEPEYLCEACGYVLEGRIARNGGFALKGRGWYKDGYKS